MNSNKAVNATSNMSKKASNMAKSGMETYNNQSPAMKIVFTIVIILFIIFVIYIIYLAVIAAKGADANTPVIVNDVIDAYVSRPAFNLPTVTTGMTQTFSTWIYVKDWNYKFGQYKNILWKGNPSTSSTAESSGNIHCPSLWLSPLTNSLKVVTSTSATTGVESCDIQNIPLMTWVHIVYVLNNRTVDIYINGQLERSCALQGIPNITADPVYITSGNPAGYYGKIGKTQYFTSALLPNDVANIYQQGPLGSTQYQIQFFTNGKVVSVENTDSFTS
jgi:hypothetical protein